MRFSCLLLSSMMLASATPSLASAYTFWPTADTLADQPLLAQKSKKKKKKKYADDTDEFGPADVEAIDHNDTTGVGVHREQEGNDTPYSAEATLATDLSFLDVQVGDADPVSSTIIDVAVEWLFILGQMEIGPDVRFAQITSAVSSAGIDEDGEVVTSVEEQTVQEYSVGGLFKWNFGNIDRSLLVPFAYGGVGYRASDTTVGDLDPVKSSGTVIRAGGGANFFIDSNIAFNPRGEFRMETDKGEGEGAVETTTTGFKVLIGIAVFI
jgi:hypothetical protein